MNFDAMCELTAAVINKAINDGAITREEFEARVRRGEETTTASYDEFIAEVRGFIEDCFFDRPSMMKKISAYWENPYCLGCKKPVDWPREWCGVCKSPKERREALTLRVRRRQRIMDL